MDITGEYRIAAPRQLVWEALNDPEVLKAAIPGCEELVKKSDTELEAKVKAKVGPVSARFGGAVTLGDLNPPESYTISGQGSGGAAGFAKGGASVHLTEDGDATVLRYEAKAEVGGKLAQIGSRLIQGTARKMADEFFGNFSRIVTERAQGNQATAAPVSDPAASIEPAAAAEPAPAAPAATVAPVASPGPAQPAAPAPMETDTTSSATSTTDARATQQPGGLEREMERVAPSVPRTPDPAMRAPAPSPSPLPPERRSWSESPLVWLGGVIVFLLLLFWLFS